MKTRRILPLLCATLLFGVNVTSAEQTLDGPGYKLRAVSAGEQDGRLYVIGGISPDGFLRKTSVYDPKTNKWTEGPELVGDSPMTGLATSTFGVGGHLYSTGASGIVYRLSDDEGEWQVADRLLFPRMFLRLLPVGEDRLIALGGTGGMTGRTSVVETLKVDPRQPSGEKIVSWTVPYEGETKHSQAFVLDGRKLYAFGGNVNWQPHDFSRNAFSKEAFVFDIANQTAERLADMPFPIQSGAGAINMQTSEHKTMVVVGGINFGDCKHHAIDSVPQYDPEAERWSVADTHLPAPRAMADTVNHDDAIWIFGGSNAGAGHGLSTGVLHWWGDTTDIAPLPEVSIPHPRRSFGGVVVGNDYFMIGGLGDGMSIESTIDVFNMENRTWRTAASPKASRVFPMVAVEGKKVYLFGGFSGDNGHFTANATLEVYDSEADTWTTLAESIEGVDASMRLFNLAGRLVFFGIDRDNDAQAKFVLYDPNPIAEPTTVAATSFSGGKTEDPGPRWHRDLTRWYRNDRMRKIVERTDLTDGISGATRGPGNYEAHFDGTDNAGLMLSPGKYTLCLEAARENGTYKIIRKSFQWGDVPIEKTELTGNIEIAKAAFKFQPAE